MAGLVIARQRPGTAKGTMFLLFEDEFGTVNLIVAEGGLRAPPPARAGRAAAARQGPPGALTGADPTGRRLGVLELSRAQVPAQQAEEIRPVINVIVRELAPLERFLAGGSRRDPSRRGRRVHRLPGSAPAPRPGEEPEGARGGREHARGRPADAELRGGA